MDWDQEEQMQQQRVAVDIENKFNHAIDQAPNENAVKAVIDQLKATHFNDTYFNSRNLIALSDVLKTGEQIQYATSGIDEVKEKSALIVVTDQRILLIDNRLVLEPKVIELDPKLITHVMYTLGHVLGRVVIKFGLVKKVALNSIYLPTVMPLVQAIKTSVEQSGNPQADRVKYVDSRLLPRDRKIQ